MVGSNPSAIKNEEIHKPILEQPRPQKSVGPSIVSAGAQLKSSPSVSFSNSDQEKVRRFTISAQPSNINLTNQDHRKNSFQGPVSVNPLIGQSQQVQQDTRSDRSSQSSSRNNSGIGSDFLSFLTKPLQNNPINPLAPHNPDSPVIEPGYQFSYRSDKITPSPPPSAPPAGPITTVDSILSKDLENSPSRPINVSRKNSMLRKPQKTIVESPVGPPVPFQEYLSKEDDGKIHVLLGCTGSVATIKVPLIIDKLFQIFGANKISIQLVITKSANHFLKGLKINNQVKIWRDEDEWANFESVDYFNLGPAAAAAKKKNIYEKLILHNELRKWADIMLIAPLSANTLAKIANGISDNLLTSIIRSWSWPVNPKSAGAPPAIKKPILVAPAMNTFMYTHPLTAKQLDLLSHNEYGFGIEVLKPVEKVLICGDIGMGGMREWNDIVDILRRRINGIKSMDKGLNEEEEEEDEEDDDDDDDDDDDEEDDDDDEEDDDEDEGDQNIRNIPNRNKEDSNDEMIFDIKND